MTSIYYNSLSGLIAASMGLKNISDSMANMQSAGFKKSDVFYASLSGYDNDYINTGSGVEISKEEINFKAGQFQATGNNNQVAIDGNGFFVLKNKKGDIFYTRDGEFHYNDDGYLVDDYYGNFVMGLNKTNQLIKIKKTGPHSMPGAPTNTVNLEGTIGFSNSNRETIQSNDIFDEKDGANKNGKFKSYYLYTMTDSNMDVYDNDGVKHVLNIKIQYLDENNPFDNDDYSSDRPKTPDKMKNLKAFLVLSYDGNEIPGYQAIDTITKEGGHEFNINNEEIDETKLTFFLTKTHQEIHLDFGHDYNSKVKFDDEPDGLSEIFNSIKIKKQDGYAQGIQKDTRFNDDGYIEYQYDNGKSIVGDALAIANFTDLSVLSKKNGNHFIAHSDKGLQITKAGVGMAGNIKPGKIEGANVDPTTEFANIVILQRMFQACSQILQIDKQLLEEIYKK